MPSDNMKKNGAISACAHQRSVTSDRIAWNPSDTTSATAQFAAANHQTGAGVSLDSGVC